MTKEFESNVLDINEKEIIAKLKKLGAKIGKEVMLRRWIFDMRYKNLECAEWIRLRDNGNNVTIAYKKRAGFGISDTSEVEVEVSDFDKTYKILSKLNFEVIYYQENKRRIIKLGDIEYSIDKWPKIPPLLEVESDSKKNVKKGLKLLELSGKDIGHLSMGKIYQKYGIDLFSFKELKYRDKK